MSKGGPKIHKDALNEYMSDGPYLSSSFRSNDKHEKPIFQYFHMKFFEVNVCVYGFRKYYFWTNYDLGLKNFEAQLKKIEAI